MPRTYVALDLELTGLDPRRDEIIEIGLVKFRGHETLDTFSSLVKSKRPISFRVEQLSGISQSDIEDAPSLSSLVGHVLAFVRNHPIVGHSIEVDCTFLQRHGVALQNLALDTFELASILVPEAKRYSLESLADLLQLDVQEHHRALADAMASKDLFLSLLDRLETWDPRTLAEIVQLGDRSDWPILRVFRDVLADSDLTQTHGRNSHKHRGGQLPSSRAEPEDWPPLEPSETLTPLDADELVDMISPDGLVARSFQQYEYRPQQVDMLRAVCEAFNVPTHALLEGGTGVGKSLAYLLPAIRFATQNGRRVLVSSNTINLQDQLHGKDIPHLQSVLPIPVRAALLKGRGNYICLRRLAAFRQGRVLSADQVRVLAKILAWLPTTRTGDRNELLLLGNEGESWAQVQSSSDVCLGDNCPYRQQGRCFFSLARVRAERAHLVIVNHALLLTDLAMERSILPEYEYLIIDEAHHLEEQATSQFGFETSSEDIYAFLSGLSHTADRSPGGLLSLVPALLTSLDEFHARRKRTMDRLSTLVDSVESAQRRLYELFNSLGAFVDEHAPSRGGQYDHTVRLTSALYIQPSWSNVEIAYDNLATPLRQIAKGVAELLADLQRGDEGTDDAQRDEILQGLQSYAMQAAELCRGMDRILLDPEPETIAWITVARRNETLSLHSAPLHVGELLAERLFAAKECVILTSATLRTGDSFRYIKNRLGIEDALEVGLDSPFDYERAVLLYVPKDIPEPNQPNYQRTVERALVDLVKATEGRALILFTSNSQLRRTYQSIRGELDDEEIIALAQGVDGSRRRILDSFRSTPRSVLLGTRSFWEGVDIVGDALSCVAIARLPFAVPTDPIIAARAETFQDPFGEYYLPDAILRFRQGFGRLIRSQTDVGVVAVLDKRILTKAYGTTMLRSIPRCTARQGPLERLPILAARWLDPESRQKKP